MIIDHITNSHLYYTLSPRIKQAFEYIHQNNLLVCPAGKYEIDGDKLYVMIQEYNTKPREQGVWEAHRRYIDLQYIIQGVETIGYANIGHLTQGEYDASKDFLPLFGDGNLLPVQSGSFMLLMPEDAHMPGLAVAAPAPVRKVVIKIAID